MCYSARRLLPLFIVELYLQDAFLELFKNSSGDGKRWRYKGTEEAVLTHKNKACPGAAQLTQPEYLC